MRKGMCVRFENGNVAKVHQKYGEYITYSITDLEQDKTYPMIMRLDTPVTKITEDEWWEVARPVHLRECARKGILNPEFNEEAKEAV